MFLEFCSVKEGKYDILYIYKFLSQNIHSERNVYDCFSELGNYIEGMYVQPLFSLDVDNECWNQLKKMLQVIYNFRADKFKSDNYVNFYSETRKRS